MAAKREQISAMPTKRLFIEMLVKDVDLTDAIIDLVDNSIDGAKRLRPDGNFTDLKIEIAISEKKFLVKDNCGGIPIEVGKNYAFRFGRPNEATPTNGSIGRFGIGMKRALFKLGKDFKIKTTSDLAKYSLTVDVIDWSKNDAPETWNFQTDAPVQLRSEISPYGPDELGTQIEVTNLYSEVAKRFQHPTYETEFRARMRSAQNSFLLDGLTILVNGTALISQEVKLLQDSLLKPTFKHETIKAYEKAPAVNARYYVGLQGSIPPDHAGWYVYCNGRLILRADRSEAVGWGERSANIPRYHNQYARFRGYAFFDCSDSEQLPWNTTKTGLDLESTVYAKARRTMVALMEPTIRFIDAIDDERDSEDKTYTEIVSQAVEVSIDSMKIQTVFKLPPKNNSVPAKLYHLPKAIRRV